MEALPPASIESLVSESALAAPSALLIITCGVLYLLGVRRLRARGRQWSIARSAAFGSGLVVLVIATQSGLAAYGHVLFSAHVAEHVSIGMVAPFLLALGAPVTLALQASSRPVQVRFLRVLHSRPVSLVTHPVVAWLLFGVTLFGLYFTPLYQLSLENHVVHHLVHAHFLLAGCVFFWAVIGLDPVSHRIHYGFRLLLVMLTVPFHAFLGLALMVGDEPLARSYYEHTPRPDGAPLLADQHLGAGLMWAVGDLTGLVAGAVVLAQWMAHESRISRRADAREDHMLGAIG